MRLHLLRLGTIRRLGAPVPGYLVESDDGSCILVDTGPPAGDPLPSVPIDVAPEEGLEAQLATAGVEACDVKHVVCTHLDPDHAGNHHLFPQATFVVQRRHYEAASTGVVARLSATRESWGASGLRYQLVDGDTDLVDGVRLVATDGHVVGHQSVLVNLPSGAVLLAADAIPVRACADPDTRFMTPFDLDPEAVRASTRKLVELAAGEHATLVFGHDGEQWAELAARPGWWT